jgi:hypothetical protein
MYDYADIPETPIIITLPTDTNLFSFDIPTDALDGTYTAVIYWYNGTDASVQTQEFQVSFPSPPTPEFPWLPVILGILIAGAAIGILGYIASKRINSIRREKLENLLYRCNDISILEYILVLDNKSGIDLYSQSFGVKQLDSTLLSGFLQAIRTFGAEVSQEAKESRTLKLEYKDSIMMMTEFVNLKLVAILKDNPSPNFKFIMEDLAYNIYKDFGEEIDNYSGNLKPFVSIKDLTEKHLNVSFLYPMKIIQNPKTKLSITEKEMVNRAKDFLKEYKAAYFYSLYLMPENVCSPKDYQIIISLMRKGIFKPVDYQ